jgi:hypothetical protein
VSHITAGTDGPSLPPFKAAATPDTNIATAFHALTFYPSCLPYEKRSLEERENYRNHSTAQNTFQLNLLFYTTFYISISPHSYSQQSKTGDTAEKEKMACKNPSIHKSNESMNEAAECP